ncbi:hypothetical protein, partial [Kribbella sp.]|uniref:hypothetical protein n=1 Tax=Kribbella sp. TaxID=1871183 RepID=UPI002D497AB0
VVKEASKVADNRFLPLAAWRGCAGSAHGRSWAALAFLEKEEFPTHDPEVVRLRVTNTLMKVWWVTKSSHVL